jgi:N-acetylneuraminate synthase
MTEEIAIGNRVIGSGREPFIIAEAGINHNGDVKLAKEMIKEAIKCGADAIKFQTFTAENIMVKEAESADHLEKSATDESVYDFVKKISLDRDEFRELAESCKRAGIIFLSTAGTPDDVDFLDSLDVPAFKIASMDLNNLPLLNHIAKKKKPTILSTGMGNMDDVVRAVRCFIDNGNNQVIILQCTSRYPTPPESVNLKAMDTLRERFLLNVGFSDHTEGIIIPLAAIARGAVVVEKHYTLDKTMEGPDHKISADPEELASIVKGSKVLFKALGTGEKEPDEFEKKMKTTFCRSIVSNRELKKGERLDYGSIAFKRPGTGISPADAEKVIGKRVKRAIPADTVIFWDNLE